MSMIPIKIERREPIMRWIPCSERLPEINHPVLLSTNKGHVYVGERNEAEIIYQVTKGDGRTVWVYDPEDYTDDIDSLPKSEDCVFDCPNVCGGVMASVLNAIYQNEFEGVTAWMPLPEAYKKE